MVRRGKSMGYRESFDEHYSKRLNELKVALKSVLYGDLFVVGPEYACKKCQGRVKLHTQEGVWYCLRCALRPGAVSPRWSKETRARVEEIMASYPDQQECYQEWSDSQPKLWTPPPAEPRVPKPEPDPEKIEFGKRLKEARRAKGLTIEQLAAKVIKQKRNERLSSSAIQTYESGEIFPSDHIMEQLVR